MTSTLLRLKLFAKIIPRTFTCQSSQTNGTFHCVSGKKNTDSDVARFTHKLDRKRIHGCFTCKTRLMAEKVDLLAGKLLWKIA